MSPAMIYAVLIILPLFPASAEYDGEYFATLNRRLNQEIRELNLFHSANYALLLAGEGNNELNSAMC